MSEREVGELQALLEALPSPLEPLDISGIDGFLCGLLVQPEPVGERHWWPFVLDVDGRAAPPAPPAPAFDAVRLRHLVTRRHGQLAALIARRDWFDPWVFEGDAAGLPAESETLLHPAVAAWAAGCALALETFPRLLEQDDDETLEALALIYQHLETGHLEEAEALVEAIESLEPPTALDAAVQDLVRAIMLLADAAGQPVARR